MLNKFFMLILLVLTFNFSLSTVVFGAVPQMMNFQGRLTDDVGQPITGTRDLKFRIYDDPILSTSLLWGPETQNNVPVTDGIFSVQLGSFTPLGQNVFNNTNCYLEIEVEGSILTPRQQIIAHAYSYVAETLVRGADVSEVSISTLSLTGSRMYLLGGEGAGAGVFYIERTNTGEPRDILQMTFRLTGTGGLYYDPLKFEGKNANFYKGTQGAILNMEGNEISNIGDITASSMTVNTIFYPPSGTSLPTGVSAGGLFYDTDSYILYLATETSTVGDESWVILGGAGQN
jgi:hypothetical protein